MLFYIGLLLIASFVKSNGLSLTSYSSFPPAVDIPSGTTLLTFVDSTFPMIPSGGLDTVNGSLTELHMQSCGMTEVGDIQPVGATLQRLYIGYNPFVILQNGTFDGLIVLTHLDVTYCSLTTLPDLTPFADTLQLLQIVGNTLGYIPANRTAVLKSLIHLKASTCGLTHFPDLSGSYETLQTIEIQENYITHISGQDMQSFVLLNSLMLYSNQLTSLSNITSPALETLSVVNNPLMFGPDLPLTAPIKSLSLSGTADSEFPDLQTRESLETLEIPAITFKEVPSEKLMLLTGLQQLFLTNQPNALPNKTMEFPGNGVVSISAIFLSFSQIVLFPDFNYLCKSLTYVDLQFNNIAYIPVKRLLALQKLNHLFLSNNELTVMPFTGHLNNMLARLDAQNNDITEMKGTLRSVQRMDLNYNHITHISSFDAEMFTKTYQLGLFGIPILTQFSDPHGNSPYDLKIDIRLSQVDLCSCKNIWMKIANDFNNGNTVSVTDRLCSGIEDLNWSQYNTTELLKYCNDENLRGNSNSGWSLGRKTWSPSCQYPVHAFFRSIKQVKCVLFCLEMKGCLSYKWRPLDVKRGDCVLLVPQPEPVPSVEVTDEDDPGWTCHHVHRED